MVEGRPVDALGEPLPWITYPAIEFLSQFDFCNASVLKWGSGFQRYGGPNSYPLNVDAEIQALIKHDPIEHDGFYRRSRAISLEVCEGCGQEHYGW